MFLDSIFKIAMFMDFLLRKLSVAAFILFLYACGRTDQGDANQSIFFDSTIRAMYDARTKGDTAFLKSFGDAEQAAYRALYAKLMGSLTPKDAPEDLKKLLRDPIPYVRLYAAFAIGQIGDEKALPDLEKAFKKATIPEIKAELLEAIGKCANENAMQFLVEHNPNTAIEESGKMWAIYRGMLKGQLQEKHLSVVVAHLASSEEETRLAAAHTLSRQREFNLEKYAKEILDYAKNEGSPHIKAALGYALSETSLATSFCNSIFEFDSDVLTRVAALNVAPRDSFFIGVYEDALLGGAPLEVMVAVKKLSAMKNYTPSLTVVNGARSSSIPEFKALIAAKLLEADVDAGNHFYREAWNDLSNPIKRSILLGVWSETPSGLDTLRKYLFQDNSLGSAATMAYLRGTDTYPEWEDSLVAFAKKSFNDGLIAQTCLYSEALSDKRRQQLLDEHELISALEEFREPQEVEAYKSLANAIQEIFGTRVPPAKLEYAPVNWELLQNLAEKPILAIYSRGQEYEVQLVPEDAPASCSYVIEYAEAHRYDGTYFHRVVPGFVSQGGGPRGDGYGSGKDLVRSEFSSLKYGSGVVGLASAGKDTESCQFFITHTATPHLDGRYSIIGAALSDIFSIETGTRIDSIRLKHAN
jgi:cyclophilin family peptidyl-prolyl cis-trans isomerase